MEDLRCAFKEFDINEDGCISKEELARVMENFNSLVSEEELEQMQKEAHAQLKAKDAEMAEQLKAKDEELEQMRA